MAKVSNKKKNMRVAFARERGAMTPKPCPMCGELLQTETHWRGGQLSLQMIMDGATDDRRNWSCVSDGPGEEDGPWAEGWAERSGEGLPPTGIEDARGKALIT
jgi:hypothetical protein